MKYPNLLRYLFGLLCLFLADVALAQSTPFLSGQTSTTASNAGTTVTLTVPTSAQVGDLLLAQVVVDGATPNALTNCGNITAPTGWTLVGTCAATSSHIVQGIYSKTATASDPGSSVKWTISSSHSYAGTMVSYSFAGGVEVTSSGQATSSQGTATAPTLTTLTANDIVVDFFGAAYGTTITPAANNYVAGPTNSSAGSGGAGAVATDYIKANAGSTGTQTASLATNAYWAAEQVAIKPTSTATSCSPPSTVTAALGPYSSGTYTCYCDTFNRASVNPSTIYSSNWLLNTSNGNFGVPKIVDPGRLRLTDNTGNNAQSATVPGIFPAAGNYISVEFNHYAYNGSGADGVAVTLSDASVPAVPGGYGGSQGYAPEGTAGFAGGWIGVALDEYGNYSNPIEGRPDGPGFIAEQVGMRGPGSGTAGYDWISGSGANPGGLSIDDNTSLAPSTGYKYQVIVDARNESAGTINVAVNRDSTTMNGNSYSSVIPLTNVYSFAQNAVTQGWISAIVPTNWQISFTSSTGGSTNIHEIGSLRVCAQSSLPPNAGNSSSNFNAIDSANAEPVNYVTATQGHIFTKLAGVAFPLDVIAFNGNSINTAYASSAVVQLLDDSGAATSCNSSATACSGCSDPVITSQSVTFTAAKAGQIVTGNFSVPSAYSRVIARICQGTSCTGSSQISCSSDAFTVRPTGFSSVSSSATNASTTGTPVFSAGTTPFTLSAVAAQGNYGGVPQINPAGIQVVPASGVVGTFNPAAFPQATASNSTASGSTFTYGDVGNFTFLGYSPTSNTSSARGIYDSTWVGSSGTSGGTIPNTGPGTGTSTLYSSSDQFNGDCNAGSYSNTIDSSGKYGCNFGIIANSSTYGRFVPDHFIMASGSVIPAVGGSSNFTYMGEPFGISYVLNACSGTSAGGACTVTKNYSTAGFAISTPALVAEDQAAANLGTNLAPRITVNNSPTPSWIAGVYTVTSTVSGASVSSTNPLSATFSLPSTQPGGVASAGAANAGGPFDLLAIGVNMTDVTDAGGGVIYNNDMNPTTSVTCSGTTCNAKQIGTTTSMREGRLTLSNAYGSEQQTLPVTVTAQYYDTSTLRWITNIIDTGSQATTIPVNGAVLSNAAANVSGGAVPSVVFLSGTALNSTQLAQSPSLQLSGGIGTYTLYSKGVQGTVDMALNLGATSTDNSCNSLPPNTSTGANEAWLQYLWCGSTRHDPNARLKFGSPKSPVIYLREMY